MEDSIDSIGMFSLNVGRDVINSITLYIVIVSWSPLKVVIHATLKSTVGIQMKPSPIEMRSEIRSPAIFEPGNM
jgi:hypothetical protein